MAIEEQNELQVRKYQENRFHYDIYLSLPKVSSHVDLFIQD